MRWLRCDRAQDRFEQMADRAVRGDVLLLCGRFADAETSFLEAERITYKDGSPISILAFFYWGFGYNELLLTLGRVQEAQERARRDVALAVGEDQSLIAVSQAHLSLGSALTVAGDDEAAEHLQCALEQLRQATHQLHLPRAPLPRSRRTECRTDGVPKPLQPSLDSATPELSNPRSDPA